jgi:large subunit ribosomal protein L23
MQIIVTPRATEKAYASSQSNIYVFDTPLEANKNQIVEAVQSQYGVTVVGIKTLVQSGKAVRYSRGKNRYPGTTHRKDTKKAYVTLAEGDSIKVFEEPVAEDSKSKKADDGKEKK